MESWFVDNVYLDCLATVDVQQLGRAMDFLLEAHDDIQKEVFWSFNKLLNLEVDLLFIDTTTTYFLLRRRGRGGVAVRCWVWPWNTNDVDVVDEVKCDLNAWKFVRVIMVMDVGFHLRLR